MVIGEHLAHLVLFLFCSTTHSFQGFGIPNVFFYLVRLLLNLLYFLIEKYPNNNVLKEHYSYSATLYIPFSLIAYYLNSNLYQDLLIVLHTLHWEFRFLYSTKIILIRFCSTLLSTSILRLKSLWWTLPITYP